MNGPVLLAGDRQMQGGKYVLALFLVVWGGLFGGIPLAMLFLAKFESGGDKAVVLLFPLLGIPAFLFGLYIALKREEVWFDPLRDSIEQRLSFLGRVTATRQPRKLFDRVHLRVEIGKEDRRSYTLALAGAGPAEVELGDFSERNEALTAGMRAARRAGLAFEEKQEGGPLLRLDAAELAGVPAAEAPQDRAWWRRPAPLALVAANLIPVWGVLFAGWHILPVMLLFWMENLVVGGYTLLKMLLARGAGESGATGIFRVAGNLFLAGFFTFHYGMFCMVHGVFVVTLFADKGAARAFRGDLSALPGFALDLAGRHGLLIALFALVVSHGISLYVHYLKPRAYEDAEAGKIMFEPYKRIVILHVVILFGGFIAQATGSGIVPLLMLIGLKTAVDLASHGREHAMPHEREMRDYMAEHGKVHLTVEPPAPAPAGADRNDMPLAHYLGVWAAAPEVAVPAGWIARAEFREVGGNLKARLWSPGPGGEASTGELDASVRGSAARVAFVDVRQRSDGRMRIARFTGSDAGADCIDLNEIQHPEGKPEAMQAKSMVLRRLNS